MRSWAIVVGPRRRGRMLLTVQTSIVGEQGPEQPQGLGPPRKHRSHPLSILSPPQLMNALYCSPFSRFSFHKHLANCFYLKNITLMNWLFCVRIIKSFFHKEYPSLFPVALITGTPHDLSAASLFPLIIWIASDLATSDYMTLVPPSILCIIYSIHVPKSLLVHGNAMVYCNSILGRWLDTMLLNGKAPW